MSATSFCVFSFPVIKPNLNSITSLELDNNLDLVSAGKETASVVDLGLEVVGINGAGKSDLLDVHDLLLLFRFLFLFIALKTEFSVINYLAYGRISLSRDHYEIESLVVCMILRCGNGEQSHLLALRSDDTYNLRRSAENGFDLVINIMLP